MNGGYNRANLDAAVNSFEQALRLDPGLTSAKVGLAAGLAEIFYMVGGHGVDFRRVDASVRDALSAAPGSAWAHLAKAKREFALIKGLPDEAVSNTDAAIGIDPNFAEAHAFRGVLRMFMGQAKEAIPEIETALRLNPRSPSRNLWESDLCSVYAHLGQWEKAVEWCRRSIATDTTYFVPYVNLAAAYGWLDRDIEATWATVALLKLKPGFTVSDSEKLWYSTDPQYELEQHRIMEGLRKAGLPEQ
jgi:tetratricopeptide (TPR) repeat protein